MDENTSISKKNAYYDEIISIIERAKENAFRAVNRELISMYWDIGNHVSRKLKAMVGENRL